MDTTTLNLTIAGLAVAVNAFTWITSTYVLPKWGKTGVQVIVAFFALLGALYLNYQAMIPGLKETLITLIGIFSLSISLYETIWSKLETPKVLKK